MSHLPSIRRRTLLAAVAASAVLPSLAQTFPNKPMRVVVPAVAGSSADMLARLLGERVVRFSGHPWVVDNRPGAGGIIGSDAVAKAEPDGHTLLFTANNFVISPAMYPSVPYDVLKDFAPVSLVSTAPNFIFINAASGVTNMADLIALARRTPEGLNYGSPFVGTSAHLTMEMLRRAADINLVHVPSRGMPQAFTEALSGRVPLVIGSYSDGAPFLKSGALRAIAVVDARRMAALPEVPTLVELGYPQFDFTLWFGLLAPARTPASVIARTNQLVADALATRELADGLIERGFVPKPSSPAAFTEIVRKELGMYSGIVRETGIKA
jgi:tripartite-type tricarboxylate transporter receptor subunit TctC